MSKKQMNILIVEDDVNLHGTWERDIKDFNNDPAKEISFTCEFAQDVTSALEILEKGQVNFIVADLRLPKPKNRDTYPEEGNKLMEIITNQFPSVTAINSGFPEELIKTNLVKEIKIFTKGAHDNYSHILNWFVDQSPMALALTETLNEFKKLVGKTFHHSIWPRWSNKWAVQLDNKEIESIICRQCAEYITQEITQKRNIQHHPEEFYIIPPQGSKLHTGDLTELDGQIYIAVSPQCDMANGYPDNILLAKCEECCSGDSNDKWGFYCLNHASETSKRKADAHGKIRDLLNQNIDKSSHFLLSYNNMGPWYVNFKHVRTIPSSKVDSLLSERIVRIAPTFVPNLIQRFSAYIGRVGQMDINPSHIDASIAHSTTS